MSIAPKPKSVPARVMRCRDCGDLVEVIELPGRYLDPATYVCGDCAWRTQGAQ